MGIVAYLNTKPLIQQIETFAEQQNCELVFSYPSRLTHLFQQQQIDVALLPVAHLHQQKHLSVVSDYCIGCNGKVASVGLITNEPLNKIHSIFFDPESTTSNRLLQILCEQHWHISPLFLHDAVVDYNNLSQGSAALVIGDKAFEYKPHYNYYYDLGTAWKEMTNLPFVFATWIASKKLPELFIEEFNLLQQNNLSNLDALIKQLDYKHYNLNTYFTKNISYTFDEEKKKALALFLNSW